MIKNQGNIAYIEKMDNFRDKNYNLSKKDSTADISFRTDSGTLITKEQFYTVEILEDYQAGRPVKLFYDPSDPQNKAIFEKVVLSNKINYYQTYVFLLITMGLLTLAFFPRRR